MQTTPQSKMSSIIVHFLLILGILFVSCAPQKEFCQVDILHQFPDLAPVFITSQNELAKPNGRFLELKVQQKFEIICNGKENGLASCNLHKRMPSLYLQTFLNLTVLSIRGSKPKHGQLECRKDGIYVGGKKNGNFACLKETTADIITFNERCATNGILKYIGYRTKNKNFVEYIKVCYNEKEATPIYTYHKIWGRGVRYTKSYERPYFETYAISNHPAIISAYKKQLETLNNLLGKSIIHDKFGDVSKLFTKGHLVPSFDGIFKSWQYATYFFINTAPQFQAVNRNNWQKVEILVRRKAEELQDELEVFTGVSGVLKLKNENNTFVPIYLYTSTKNEKFIPVPAWFWKVVKHGKKGIAFITYNNPFAIKLTSLCESICNKYKWGKSTFNTHDQGYTVCCSVQTLKQLVPNLPQMKVEEILDGPQVPTNDDKKVVKLDSRKRQK